MQTFMNVCNGNYLNTITYMTMLDPFILGMTSQNHQHYMGLTTL